MSKIHKLPAMQFYVGDWRKDPGVQALGFHERGVWFEMICLMHESEERGKLMLNGLPMPDDALARLLGLDKQNLTTTITTLLSYGVASRCEETGAIICRRMIRDENLRKVRAECGKQGGNPNLVKQKPTTKDKQKSTPSSSSSISVSSSNNKKENPSIDQVRTFCAEIDLPETDGDATYWKWEGNGWTNGNKPIKNWKATIRSWKAAGHMPSQKQATKTYAKPQPSIAERNPNAKRENITFDQSHIFQLPENND
jgi:hypothetical protein